MELIMENDELLYIWSKLQGYCINRCREGTEKECILYSVCTHRDCEPESQSLSRKIKKAMMLGTPIEYNGLRYDYICGYSLRSDRRNKKSNETYLEVELMDESANSVVRVQPDKVNFINGEMI